MNLSELVAAAELLRVPNVPGFGHQLIGYWQFPKRIPTTPEGWIEAAEAARAFVREREVELP